MELSTVLRVVANSLRYPKQHPIADLGTQKGTVFVDASRQIYNLVSGLPMYAHWVKNMKLYTAVSGTRRLDMTSLGDVSHIPELGEASEENMRLALNKLFQEQIDRGVDEKGKSLATYCILYGLAQYRVNGEVVLQGYENSIAFSEAIKMFPRQIPILKSITKIEFQENN